jgi:ShK domain-like
MHIFRGDTMTRISIVALSLLLCLWLAQVTVSQSEEQCVNDKRTQKQAPYQHQQQQQGYQQGKGYEHLDEPRQQSEYREQLRKDAKIKFSDTYPCYDEIKTCPNLAKHNGCIENFAMMRQKCRKTCLLCIPFDAEETKNIYSIQPQKTEGLFANEIRKLILESDNYMYNKVYVEEQYEMV